MNAKTISVALRADISDFATKMGAASAQAKKAATDITGVFTTSDRQTKESLEKVSRGALLLGGAMLAGLGVAVKVSADFEKAMSGVSAATRASAQEMGRLREAALQAGADTVFTASEAAQAQTELAKAGVSTADILGGALTGALSLAAAGGLDLARAAEIAATTMTIFGKSGRDVAHVADVIAAAAGKSAADVDDIAQAMNQGGLVATQFNLSLEDTSGILAFFAASGLKGSDAGTSFKTMLQRLVPTSDEARETMEQLGLQFFNAEGRFVGIEGAAEQLQERMKGLSEEQRAQAMQTIFGADAVRAATVLYRGGGEAVELWRKKVDDSGYAADQAARRLDNLAGDVEQLGGSIQTGLIQSGTSANAMLRSLVQGATGAVNAFSSLPTPLLAAGLGFVGVTGGGLALLGVAGTMIPKIHEVSEALHNLGRAGQFANSAIGVVGKGSLLALPGLVAGFTLWANSVRNADDAVADHLDRLGTSAPQTYEALSVRINSLIDEHNRLWEVARGGGKDSFLGGLYKNLNEFAQNISPWHENTIRNAEQATKAYHKAIEPLQQQLKAWGDNTRDVAKSTGLTYTEVETLAQKLGVDLGGAAEEVVPRLITLFGEMDAGTQATYKLGKEGDVAAEKIKNLESAIARFIDPLGAYRDAVQEVTDEERKAADQRGRAATRGIEAEERKLSQRQQMLNRELEDQRTASQRRQAAERDALVRGVGESEQAFSRRRNELERRQREENDALEDRRTALARSVEDEKAKLAERTAAVREAAEKEQAAEEERKKKAELSVKGTLDAWQAQIDTLNAWQANILKIASRGHDGVADYLASLGPDAAPLVERFASATEEEFRRLETQLPFLTGNATEGIRRKLQEAGPALSMVASTAGQQTADAYATALAKGETTVAEIMARYKATIAGAVPYYLAAPEPLPYYLAAPGYQGPVRRQNPDGSVTDINPNVREIGVTKRARGGPTFPGRSYWVGEEGPELLHMGAAVPPGYVLPHKQSMAMAAALPSRPVSGGFDVNRLAATLAPLVGQRRIEVNQTNEFRGGDIPTEAAMDYAGRRLGWELSLVAGTD